MHVCEPDKKTFSSVLWLYIDKMTLYFVYANCNLKYNKAPIYVCKLLFICQKILRCHEIL